MHCECESTRDGKYIGGKFLCRHNNLSAVNPTLSEEWDYKLNKLGPENYSPMSDAKVFWICRINPCGCHSFSARISDRNRNTGCPMCSNRKLCPHNNLAYLNPELSLEWDYEKNEDGPENYSQNSGKKVFWICKNNVCGCHKWQAQIRERNRSTGCPFCTSKRVCEHNNLAYLQPELMKEWDYDKNKIAPDKYSQFTLAKVWWICSDNRNHKWRASISHRSSKSGCPFCKSSKGERYIVSILRSFNIPYEREWNHPNLGNKRFDFYFTYNNKIWIIEYDGIQHFKYNDFYHRNKEDFIHRQQIDKIKSFAIINSGYNLIRIDYTNNTEEKIKDHICYALHSNNHYYSNPEMYKYIYEGTIDEKYRLL